MNKVDYKDVLLCYHANAETNTEIPKENFLPMVAYIKDKKIVDLMWKSFIFLPSPNYIYNDSGKRPFNIEDCKDYIHNKELKKGVNIDALNLAVGEVKEELKIKDYKAEIYMSLLAPANKDFDFGIVNGRNLNYKNLEDRTSAMKWMADESIKAFEERNYENVKLAGFYWFEEGIQTKEQQDKLLVELTDYVRSRGLVTCWCPYCLANGCEFWDKLGIDFASQQPNYFSEHLKHFPNRGTSERFKMVSDIHKKNDLGVAVELSGEEDEDVKILKENYKSGIEMDYMKDTHHIYYYLNTFLTLYKSESKFYKSAYDETYKYINGKLTKDEIYFG